LAQQGRLIEAVRARQERIMVQNYPVPNAWDYNAPSPRAAKVAQQPYAAPEADLNQLAHTGFDMAENGLGEPTSAGED
jgi:hypothetical protein